jgi:hypothetical protein
MSKKQQKKEYESPSLSVVKMESGSGLCQTSGTSTIELAAATSDISVESFTLDDALTW